MKNYVKKGITMLVAFTTLCSVAACGNKNGIITDGEDTKNLHIYAAQKGYGTDMLKAIISEFKKDNPGIEVHFKETTLEDQIMNTFELGRMNNDYDIYFTCTGTMYSFLSNYAFDGYSKSLYDLTSIYQKTIPGETATIEDKMYPYFKEYFNVGTDEQPEYRALSWATGMMGLCYNADVVKSVFGADYKSELPRTTTELKEFATTLKNNGKVPFVFPGGSDYFTFSMLAPWWAQYEGLESFERFFEGRAYDEISGRYVYSADIYKQQGRLEALEALYSLINKADGLVLDAANDYDNNNFRTLQTRFVNKSQNYAMYPNGDWLEQESVLTGDSEIAMMKTPVISSIVDRLETIKTEAALREVISYVDGEATTVGEYSAEDIEEVAKARNIVATSHGLGHTCWVPAYTNAPTLVEKFLLFMYSDEGMKIYKQNCKGGFLPATCNYDDITLSAFEQSVYELSKNIVAVGTNSKSPIFNQGGAQVWDLTNGKPDAAFSLPTSSSYYATPQQFFNRSLVGNSQWESILIKAGLI